MVLPVEEGKFLGVKQLMLITLFNKNKKLIGRRFISLQFIPLQSIAPFDHFDCLKIWH